MHRTLICKSGLIGLAMSILLGCVLLSETSAAATVSPAKAPARRSDVYLHSQTLRQNLAAKKTAPQRLKTAKASVLQLERELKTAMELYVSNNPVEGAEDEQELSIFFYTLEPLFQLAKKSSPVGLPCDKARHQIEFEDRMGRPEDETLTEDAVEALAWVTIFCRK